MARPHACRSGVAVVRMTSDLLTRSVDELANGRDLSAEQTAEVLAEIMSGNASEIQIAAFLIALRTKGETVEELAGLARTMRSFAATVTVARDRLLDTAGTGGGRRTFNVSTTAALIAAGASRQLIGVSDAGYLEKMAGALALLGTEHALLVSSHDGLDELSISAPTRVVEVVDGEISSYDVEPADVGLACAAAADVPGGDPV